jgi:hypothetical protein
LKPETNLYTDDSLVELFFSTAGKTAFRPRFFREDPFRLTQSRNVLRGIPHVLDAAAKGFPEFRTDAATIKDAVDYFALTPLYVFIMISEECYHVFRPKF